MFGLKCYACNNKTHDMMFCPIMHFIPDKE